MSSGPTRVAQVYNYTDEGSPADPTRRVVADTTQVKAVHVNELRTMINLERASRQSTPAWTWTSGTVTANVAKITKAHMDELRAAELSTLANGCSTDTTPAPTWTDPTIVVNSTLVKAAHINDLRIFLTALGNVTCLCNCNYSCSDCGCNGWCFHH